MSKYDYLHSLYQELKTLDPDRRNEIMRDVENQFKEAESNELDELFVTNSLGSPTEYSRQFTMSDLELATDPIIEPQDIQPTHYTKETPTNKIVYANPQSSQKLQPSNPPILMLLIAFGTLLFNLIIVLGPFVAVWSVLLSLIVTGFALSITGITVLFYAALSMPIAFASVPLVIMSHPMLLYCFGFLSLGIGGLLSIAMIYSIKFCGIITARYFSWNLRLIRGF